MWTLAKCQYVIYFVLGHHLGHQSCTAYYCYYSKTIGRVVWRWHSVSRMSSNYKWIMAISWIDFVIRNPSTHTCPHYSHYVCAVILWIVWMFPVLGCLAKPIVSHLAENNNNKLNSEPGERQTSTRYWWVNLCRCVCVCSILWWVQNKPEAERLSGHLMNTCK